MELLYNGTDISEDMNTTKCIYEAYLGQRADHLTVTLDREDGWEFAAGDTIKVTEDEIDTGEMTVYRVETEEEHVTIYASTVLRQEEVKDTTWKKVGFKDLMTALAKELDLKCDFFGVEDVKYDKVKQDRDSLSFLLYRAALEGCVVVIYNGSVKIINEDWLEEQEVSTDALDEIADDFRIFDYCQLGSCTVIDKDDETATHSEGDGAGMTKALDFKLTDKKEGRRFAKNLLRHENRKRRTGLCYADELLITYAGTLLTVTAQNWNEVPIVVTRIRYDIENQNTKVWFRRLL